MKHTINAKYIERFWTKVSTLGAGCWEWLGTKTPDGYGQFHAGRTMPAYRFAYELAFGPIPKGYEIDHLCENTGCVNPYHLDAITRAEHRLRTKNRHHTCKLGHPFTEHNILFNNKGQRICKACGRLKSSARRYRKIGRPEVAELLEKQAGNIGFWLDKRCTSRDLKT